MRFKTFLQFFLVCDATQLPAHLATRKIYDDRTTQPGKMMKLLLPIQLIHTINISGQNMDSDTFYAIYQFRKA